MGIFARIEKWYEEKRLQNKVNKEIEQTFSDEDREGLELINEYATERDKCGYQHSHTSFSWKGGLVKHGHYKFWCPPSIYEFPYDRPVCWLSDEEKKSIANGTAPKDKKYLKMEAFLTKYPEYKTYEAQVMRTHYGL
ncbi:MAG: hypothetical protein PHO02_06230 [Candidatus Nanoarchaeia archaeon]|nr:hypothetical protein [Candidatus Nanoarchaeia archaeon]